MKRITTTIIDESWDIIGYPSKKYVKRNGKDSVGLTDGTNKLIELNLESLKEETIRHELVHAYMQALPIQSVKLDADQVEEIMCDLVSKYALRILAQSRIIYKNLVTED